MKPRVAILHVPGTNRDPDAAQACALAGGAPRVVLTTELTRGEVQLADFQMLVFPGGFSFGDELGAGAVWALLVRTRLRDALERFIDEGRPVLGICNGFQVLVKAGLVPGISPGRRELTLSHNRSGQFECRWVWLRPESSACVFTRELTEPLLCPVAHAEGRLLARDDTTLDHVESRGLVAFRYASADGTPAAGVYPDNPNGSVADIAGVCNPAGNVLGLMPHPENHVILQQHPRYSQGERGGLGLPLFREAIRYARSL